MRPTRTGETDGEYRLRPLQSAKSRQIAVLEEEQPDEQGDGRVNHGVTEDGEDVAAEAPQVERRLADDGRSHVEELESREHDVEELAEEADEAEPGGVAT